MPRAAEPKRGKMTTLCKVREPSQVWCVEGRFGLSTSDEGGVCTYNSAGARGVGGGPEGLLRPWTGHRRGWAESQTHAPHCAALGHNNDDAPLRTLGTHLILERMHTVK